MSRFRFERAARVTATATALMLGLAACTSPRESDNPTATTLPAAVTGDSTVQLTPHYEFFPNGTAQVTYPDSSPGYSSKYLQDLELWCLGTVLVAQLKADVQGDHNAGIGGGVSFDANFGGCEDHRLDPSDFGLAEN